MATGIDPGPEILKIPKSNPAIQLPSKYRDDESAKQEAAALAAAKARAEAEREASR